MSEAALTTDCCRLCCCDSGDGTGHIEMSLVNAAAAAVRSASDSLDGTETINGMIPAKNQKTVAAMFVL